MIKFPSSSAGKEDSYRPVNMKKYGKNYTAIFRKRKPVAQQTFLYRQHTGSLEASMKTLVTLTSFKALEDIVRNQFGIKKDAIVEVKPYIKDLRNGWDTHIVTADGLPVGFTNGPVLQ